MARGLFVEPFYGGSHRAFLDGLMRHSRHEIEPLTLPEGEWRRRMRRGAQELARRAAGLTGQYEFLCASDMLDLPVFLALTRPRFDRLPVLAYFHENQFTYPRLRGTKFNSWFGQINYLSAITADRVAFNSEFHRQDLLQALRALAGQPNNWLLEGAIAEIEAKSFVLPVGVELEWLDGFRRGSPGGAPILLWNHRWEFDKAPEMFVRAVERLDAEGLPFRLVIAGEPGANPVPALVELPRRFPNRIYHFGFAESRTDYARLLWESDIAVSTTRHEFFGVGMVEALYCGCTPIAPRRYNYPAVVPAEWHERCLFENEEEFVAKLRGLLESGGPSGDAGRKSAARYGWPTTIREWDGALDALVDVAIPQQCRNGDGRIIR